MVSSSKDDGFTVFQGNGKRRSSGAPSKAARHTENSSAAPTHALSNSATKPKKADPRPLRKSGPPPYVIIRDQSAWEAIADALKNKRINYTRATSTSTGIRVVIPTSDGHRLTSFLCTKPIGYHTYALKDEKLLQVVIRGVPRELSAELIKADLIAQGLPVEEVHRMYKIST